MSSQYGDRAAGLVFLNNRHHDPTLGPFVSVDPLVIQTGQPYIYGNANPVTYSDPTGLIYDDPDDDSYSCEAAPNPACEVNQPPKPPNDNDLLCGTHGIVCPPLSRNPSVPGVTAPPAGGLLPPLPFDVGALDLPGLRASFDELASGWASPAFGACGGVEATGLVGGEVSVCSAVTRSDAGILAVGTIGEAGAEAVITAGGFVSNAQSVRRLEGWAVCFGGSATAGGGVGSSGCLGLSDQGLSTGVVVLSGNVSAGAGGSGGISLAYTRVVATDHGLSGSIRSLFHSNIAPGPPPDPAGSYPGARAPRTGAPWQYWCNAGCP